MMTILLWGHHWWLPHHKLPVPFADCSQAADQLAAAWADSNRKIRLIYQPDEFATVPVNCPNANRDTLALALAEDYPVVRHPGHVWSYEPILVSGESFATLLHYETQPSLFNLVHRLREHGFTIESVWPMASWLNALPPELSPSGAMTICALQTDRFYLYRHSAEGTRTVRIGHDGDGLTAVGTHLSGLPSQSETEYILFVTTDNALVERLIEQIHLDDEQIVGISLLSNALAKSVPINTRNPAQLLPPLPVITAPKLISLVTGLCVLASMVLAVQPVQALVSHWSNRDSVQIKKQALRLEIEQLSQNQKEFQHWQSLIQARAPDPLPWSEFLQALSAHIPTEVVLTRLQANRDGFEIEGGIIGTLSGTDWTRWQQSLHSSGATWSWDEYPKATPETAFTLKGRWQ